jgi:tetratricopeptide (TPR) repeat protein
VYRRFHDLGLTIGAVDAAPAAYSVTLSNVSVPQESVTQSVSSFDFDAVDTGYLRRLRDAVDPPGEDELRVLGRELAALLLPAQVRALLYAVISRDFASATPIRLRLTIWPRELVDLPWELAYLDPMPYLPGFEGFLGSQSRIHLVRQTMPLSATAPLAADPVKVLVAWADPCSATNPHLPFAAEEAQSVMAALTHSGGRRIHAVELAQATPENLGRALRDWQPHILHLICHGSDQQGGMLILEGDRKGSEAAITGGTLAALLSETEIRLVVLSACRTASVAQTLLRHGVGAIVAMQFPWRDATAVSFFRAFYGALLELRTIHEAIRDGRQVLRQAGPDWAAPTLHLALDMDALFAASDAPQQRARHTYRNIKHQRNADFRGRDREMAALHRLLMAPTPQPVALVGLGGMGKTQLASEYGHKYGKKYPGGVFWIDARDTMRIKADYAEISRYFDVPTKLPLDERAESMRIILQELPLPSLVIYDNLTAEADPDLFPTDGQCRILATAREEHTARGAFRLFYLTALSDADADTLLQTGRVAKTADEQAAVRAIGAMLGNLPLALALVANHIRRSAVDIDGKPNKQPFRGYLNRLKARPKEVLDFARRHFTAATRHDGKIFDAIEISYRGLSAAAQTVLTTASLFGGRSIAPSLLLSACGSDDPEEFTDRLEELIDCTLVTREEDYRLSLHAVVRLFAQDKLDEQEFAGRLRDVSAVLATHLEQAVDALDLRDVRADLSHCHSVAELCRSQSVSRQYIDLLLAMGCYYFEQKELAKAEEYLNVGLQLAERVNGPDSEQTAKLLLALGNLRQVQARSARERSDHHGAEVLYAEARRCGERALEIACTIFGPDSGKTFLYYNDLGLGLKRQGALEEAHYYYARALDVSTHANGPLHPDVAVSLNNIGNLLEDQNRYDEALVYLRRARNVNRRLSGVRSAKYAIRMNNIGRILGKQGKWRVAVARHRAALDIFLELYANAPVGHLDLAHTYTYIAGAELVLDRCSEARLCYEAALPIFVHFLGADHPKCCEVQSTLQNLIQNGC